MTFDAPRGRYTPFGLSATRTPIIAPFFADVDTRGTGTDPVAYGYRETTFEGHAAFCVSWVNVGYFSGKEDKTNSFQLLLVSRPDAGVGAFDIVFNYGRVQWETGDASNGVDGLGGSSARVGFSSGTGIPGSYSELPGSGTNGSFLDTSPVGLVHSSLGSATLGRYTFPVRSDGQIADRYVAMGDSYQSGEGAYSYESGTDNGTNKCHRSANAYPNLLVDRQVVRLQLDFVACSGAVIHDLIYSSEEDGAPLEGEAAQVDSLGTDTRLVTVKIGGNGLDFGGTIKSCVESGIKSWIPIVNWFNYSCIGNQGDEVEANLADLETGQVGEDLLDLYRLIRAKAPYARIEVVSYPRFFPAEAADNLLECASIASKADQKWINAGIVRANSAIERITSLAGVGAINMSDVLEGHELCDPEPAMNGVVDPFSPESYHPNVLGHSLMADRIEQELSTIIEPTDQIRPQETVQRVFKVQGKRFTVNVAWPGSDVETTLTSPSGQVFSRSSHNGAMHDNGLTYEYYDINSPEPGQWTVTSFGKDVFPAGEPATLSMYDMPELNRVPNAVVTTTGSGPSFTFDGTTSVDPGERLRTTCGISATVPLRSEQSLNTHMHSLDSTWSRS
nr:nidogen-like domain-containing protein [Cryobacterium sandaracinum]